MSTNLAPNFSADETEADWNPTGIGRVSEAGRFTGAYGIDCIKRTGRILDYGQ